MQDNQTQSHICVANTCLPVTQWRAEFLPAGDLQSDYYLGSAWRGALGYILKEHYPDLFSELYDTESDGGKQHPLVLSPVMASLIAPRDDNEGVFVDMIVCGKLCGKDRHLLDGLIRAGSSGLYGSPLHCLSLQQFHPDNGWRTAHGSLAPLNVASRTPALQAFTIRQAPPAATRVALHFLHPLRIKGPKGILKPHDFSVPELLTRILRRHHNLLYDWCGAGITDWHALKASVTGIRATDTRLVWHDWRRYSHRQEQHIPMGGLLGHIVLEGSGMAAVWPYLWLGQWLHVGKGTMMGLGQYALEALG
jgi:hypothetical protein